MLIFELLYMCGCDLYHEWHSDDSTESKREGRKNCNRDMCCIMVYGNGEHGIFYASRKAKKRLKLSTGKALSRTFWLLVIVFLNLWLWMGLQTAFLWNECFPAFWREEENEQKRETQWKMAKEEKEHNRRRIQEAGERERAATSPVLPKDKRKAKQKQARRTFINAYKELSTSSTIW